MMWRRYGSLVVVLVSLVGAFLPTQPLHSQELSVRDDAREARIEQALKQLQEADPLVRSAAVRTLGEVNASAYTANVAERLKDDDARVRVLALEALADLKATEYVQEITNLLKDGDAWVRGAAHWALGQLGQEKQIPESVRPSIGMAASGMLGSQNEAALLGTALKDSGMFFSGGGYAYQQYALQGAKLRGLLPADSQTFKGPAGIWQLIRAGHQIEPGSALVIVFHQYDYHPDKGRFGRISVELADGGKQGTYQLPSDQARGFVSDGYDGTSRGKYSEALSGTVKMSERFVEVDLVGSMVGTDGSRHPAERIQSAFVIGKSKPLTELDPEERTWLNHVSSEALESPKP